MLFCYYLVLHIYVTQWLFQKFRLLDRSKVNSLKAFQPSFVTIRMSPKVLHLYCHSCSCHTVTFQADNELFLFGMEIISIAQYWLWTISWFVSLSDICLKQVMPKVEERGWESMERRTNWGMNWAISSNKWGGPLFWQVEGPKLTEWRRQLLTNVPP